MLACGHDENDEDDGAYFLPSRSIWKTLISDQRDPIQIFQPYLAAPPLEISEQRIPESVSTAPEMPEMPVDPKPQITPPSPVPEALEDSLPVTVKLGKSSPVLDEPKRKQPKPIDVLSFFWWQMFNQQARVIRKTVVSVPRAPSRQVSVPGPGK